MFKGLRRAWAGYSTAVRVIGTVLAGVGYIAAFIGALAAFGGRSIEGWHLILPAAALVLAAAVAYFVGRRSYRRLPPNAAERAVEELQVARQYLQHQIDFMAELRTSLLLDGIDVKLRRLEALRRLVFEAITQGIKTEAGERVRCALLEPHVENGEEILRVKNGHHSGHTPRVERLRLRMSSVAGRALTERAPVYVPDALTSPLVERIPEGRTIGTLLCLPAYNYRRFGNDRELLGVLSVTSTRTAAFSESDRAFVSACADVLGLIDFLEGTFRAVREAQEPIGRADEE